MSVGTVFILFVCFVFASTGVLIGVYTYYWPALKKMIALFAHLAFSVAIAGTLIFFLTTRTVAYGEKADARTGETKGFKLERYKFRHKFKLAIWNSSNRQNTYQEYEATTYWNTPEVAESRWLAGSRAMYMSMKVDLDDSDPSDYAHRPIKIIYDYRSGKMYMYPTCALWCESKTQTFDDPFSESAFHEILNQLDR